jgi:hypothetical protein
MAKKADPIIKVKSRLEKVEVKLKDLHEKVKDRTNRPTIQVGKNEVVLKKAHDKPNFTSKTILTDSTWSYVEIFLMQEKSKEAEEALFYWEQVRNFYEASKSL